jgi:hypothetical protein
MRPVWRYTIRRTMRYVNERGLCFSMLVAAFFCVWLTISSLLGDSFAGITGLYSPFVWLGWLSGFIVALRRFWPGQRQQVPCLELLIPLIMLANRNGQFFIFCKSHTLPSVDELLFVFDKNFGYIEFVLGRWLHAMPALAQLCNWGYRCLPLPVVAVYLSLPQNVGPRWHRKLWLSFPLLGISGVIFYQVCPAAGPIYRFSEAFPFTIPVVGSPHPKLMPFSLLNATPSVHFAIALLLLLYSRHCMRAVQIGAVIFVLVTALATLGLGEHYFIDLIVAVPFTVGVDGISDLLHDRGQRRRVYTCFSVVLLWEMALCQGWALELSAPIVWLFSIITVIVPFVPFGMAVCDEGVSPARAPGFLSSPPYGPGGPTRPTAASPASPQPALLRSSV